MVNRLKSPVVWTAVLAQLILITGLFYPGISDTMKIAGSAIIEILTIFGVLNNPADKDNF